MSFGIKKKIKSEKSHILGGLLIYIAKGFLDWSTGVRLHNYQCIFSPHNNHCLCNNGDFKVIFNLRFSRQCEIKLKCVVQ